MLFYILFVFFCFKSFYISLIFFICLLVILLFLFGFLKRLDEKNLLFQLYSLLAPLESQMKLGLSVINAWQKNVKELKSEKTKEMVQKITDILKFQNEVHHPDKNIENFIKDLMFVHQSSSPLKRLRHLQRKVKVEQSFHIKSKRALLQIRIQSGILSFFYFGLLTWTIVAYGIGQYIHLILISFLFFCIGLLWIFKTGRTMKWSV